jgi:molecular chaperone GrpE
MLLYKKLSDFKPIELQDDEFDDSHYHQLSGLLKRIAKSDQKTAQIAELLKDEVTEKLDEYRELVDEVRQEKNKIKLDIETLEGGLLEYFDILDALNKAAEKIEDQEFINSVSVAIKTKDQINDRLGIQLIPVDEGTAVDPEVHYIIKSTPTNTNKSDSTVNQVIQNGYRRGNRLLRKASVISNAYEGEGNE